MGKSNSKGAFICGGLSKKDKELRKEIRESKEKERVVLKLQQMKFEEHLDKEHIGSKSTKSVLCKNENVSENVEYLIKTGEKDSQVTTATKATENTRCDSVNNSPKVSKFIDPSTEFFSRSGGKSGSSSSTKPSQFSKELSHGSSSFRPKKSESARDIVSLNLNLSDFEKIKVIGRGTFGKVFLVKSKSDGNIYALKSLEKTYVLRTKNLQNLKNEKKILLKIDHPFVIKMHKTFQDSNKVYMLFDYCNGGELFFHLQKLGRFTEDIVRLYAAQIYLALKYLHENGIIFRDLKPENICLDSEGNLKLIDFGLARDEVGFGSKCSTFCGTNEYIPPEVIQGNKYNFNFDWWGFGIIIYEMIYGYPPFTDRSGDKRVLFDKICNSEPNYRFKSSSVKISAEAVDLLKSLLHKDPSKRIKVQDIPNHPFFKKINFDQVKTLQYSPPIKPIVKAKEDFSNIDPCFLRENVHSPIKKPKYHIDHTKFIDF